jgi:hypothetical protein
MDVESVEIELLKLAVKDGLYREDWAFAAPGEPSITTMVDLHIVPLSVTAVWISSERSTSTGLLRTMAKDAKAKVNHPGGERTVLGIALTHAERRGLVLKNEARLSLIPADAPVRK